MAHNIRFHRTGGTVSSLGEVYSVSMIWINELRFVSALVRIPLKAGHHSGGCRASVPVHAGLVLTRSMDCD